MVPEHSQFLSSAQWLEACKKKRVVKEERKLEVPTNLDVEIVPESASKVNESNNKRQKLKQRDANDKKRP
jgi:hypothetical protein